MDPATAFARRLLQLTVQAPGGFVFHAAGRPRTVRRALKLAAKIASELQPTKPEPDTALPGRHL